MERLREIQIAESKSMANRLLVLSSFGLDKLDPLELQTQADDVDDLSRALHKLQNGSREFRLRDGGTTIRFLAARLSREVGEFKVFASKRLLQRPIQPLFDSLKDLGVVTSVHADHLIIMSQGWRNPNKKIKVDCQKSTQFASAILLSSVGLDFNLDIELENFNSSQPYLYMTIELLRRAGITVEISENKIFFPQSQSIKKLPGCEIDLSSAFSAAAVGVVKNGCKVMSIPKRSLQPDHRFVDILSEMGVKIVSLSHNSNETEDIEISPTQPLRAVSADLGASPDLFPVLAALCALAEGTSQLIGLQSLAHKESDRLKKTIELLSQCDVETKKIEDGLEIVGLINISAVKSFDFDPDQDHRMAMAAAVLKASGVDINILSPDVVTKSFPGFWNMVDVQPLRVRT